MAKQEIVDDHFLVRLYGKSTLTKPQIFRASIPTSGQKFSSVHVVDDKGNRTELQVTEISRGEGIARLSAIEL